MPCSLLCRPSWPWTQRSPCLCFPQARVEDMCFLAHFRRIFSSQRNNILFHRGGWWTHCHNWWQYVLVSKHRIIKTLSNLLYWEGSGWLKLIMGSENTWFSHRHSSKSPNQRKHEDQSLTPWVLWSEQLGVLPHTSFHLEGPCSYYSGSYQHSSSMWQKNLWTLFMIWFSKYTSKARPEEKGTTKCFVGHGKC